METVLITGGAGVVGRRLSKGVARRGFHVRALDLPGTKIDDPDVELVHGNVTDPSSLKGLLDGVKTVYHLAAVILPADTSLHQRVNVEGTRNVVAAAAEAGVEHFIHVSSASVVYPFTTEYSRSKRQGEEIVRSQEGMHWTIVRPTLVYDENGGEEFMRFFSYLRRFPVVPFIGLGRSRKRPVHTDDVMAGLIAIAGNQKAWGKTYAFSGGESIAIWDLAKLMLKHDGKSRLFVPIPVWACRALAWALGLVMDRPPLTWQMIAGIIQDADLDPSEAMADLGYKPRTVHEGFQQCWPISG
jgi:nucleoside-diphosphate-sugar epimerase